MANYSEVALAAAKQLNYDFLKDHQLEAIVKGNNVLVILLTGYGKSVIYGCLPSALKQLNSEAACVNPIVVVVAPLTVIMRDQVRIHAHA